MSKYNNPPRRNEYGRFERENYNIRLQGGSPKNIARAAVAFVCAFVTLAVMAFVWGPIHVLIYTYLPAAGLLIGATAGSAGIVLMSFDSFMVIMAFGVLLAAIINSVG
jgi:hypothetical protein